MVKVIQHALASIHAVKSLLLLGLASFSFSGHAQSSLDSLGSDSYILNGNAYKKGVYRTFEEFKYNQPSIVENYVVGRPAVFQALRPPAIEWTFL